jgi:hypothetical protein
MRVALAMAALVVVSAASAATATHVAVTPAIGKRTTTYVVEFVAPSAGRYAVEVAGPPGRCDLARFGPGRRVAKGHQMRIKLEPDLRGWCRGRYRVTVDRYATSAPSDRYVVGGQPYFRVR